MATLENIEVRSCAVGLIRRSTDRQEHSLEDQESEIRAWCERESLQLLRIFKDDAVSGSELERPGIQALLAFLGSTDKQGVLVTWKKNRLARPLDCRDGLVLDRTIEKHGWTIHALEGHKPTGNKLADAIIDLVDYHEGGEYLRNLASDTMRGLLSQVMAGEMIGGKTPYAYAKKIVAEDGSERIYKRRQKHRKLSAEHAFWIPGDPCEIQVLHRIFQTYAGGELGLSCLAQSLNADLIPSPQSGTWCAGTIRGILLNPVYTGDLVWNKETSSKLCRLVNKERVAQAEPRASTRPSAKRRTTTYAANPESEWIRIPDHHPALIERDLFERVGRLLSSRGRKHNRGRAHGQLYPLTGLAFCASCGSGMNGRIKRVKQLTYRRYYCGGHSSRRLCAPNEVDVLRFERTVLGKLRSAYLPTAGVSDLKTRIVRILHDRLVLPQEPLVDVDTLRRRSQELERKTDRALENLGLVGQRAAIALGAKIESWSAERGRIEVELRAAAKRTANASTRVADLEQAADQIMSLLWQLEEVGMHSPAVERRKMFQATVRRIDLSFETVPPKPGRKRARHRFVGASVRANGLLGIAQQAGCPSDKLLGRGAKYNLQ